MTLEGWLWQAYLDGPGPARRLTLLACADWLAERGVAPHVAYACRWMASRGAFPAFGEDWWWCAGPSRNTDGILPPPVWHELTGGQVGTVYHVFSSATNAVRGLGGSLERLRRLVLLDPGTEMYS